MTTPQRLFIAAALGAAACASDPASSVRVIELATPELPEVAPGADVTYCTYLDYEAEAELDVINFVGQQTEYGHHTILYTVRSKQPPGTHECTEADMINVGYLAAGGVETASASLGEGVAFRMKQGAQLMIQSHFINTTSAPIRGTSRFEIEVAEPDASRAPANLFTVVTTEIEVPAHAAGTGHAECVVQERTQLVMLGGHAHEWGSRVQIRVQPAGGEMTMLYDQAWSEEVVLNPELHRFDPSAPLVFEPGDKIVVDCEYDNTTDEPLGFPREMCVAFGYAFPAEREVDCVDGHWPG